MNPTFLIIDLFCGAGGTTTGFAMTDGIAKVIACVNHDAKAIESHWRNHPEVHHFEEDIRTLDMRPLVEIATSAKAQYPDAKLILWASLECTNFSKAKGGLPRDADSRTLANHLHRYITALNPDYIQIENVVEFMSWGPLDENGKPVSRKNGADWLRWRTEIKAHGYHDDWCTMNSADYGAYTSRNRLFGIFAKPNLPIGWPSATHSKKLKQGDMFTALKPWQPVKEVLDFSDEGESIFNRKKALSEKTLERIYAGLIKYVAGGKDAYMIKYMGNDAKTGLNNGKSLDEPCPVIATSNRLGLVQTSFISKYYSGKPNGKNIPVTGPAGTVTCIDSQALVNAQFITQRNSGNPEGRLIGIDGPARTLTATGGNQDLVQPCFMVQYNGFSPESNTFGVNRPMRTITAGHGSKHNIAKACFLHSYYGNGDNNSNVEKPAPTLTTKDRCVLIQPQYLLNYHHSSSTNDVEAPCPTLTTKDKLAIVQPEFIDKQYGSGPANHQSLNQPAGSITTNDHHCLISSIRPFVMPTGFDNTPS